MKHREDDEQKALIQWARAYKNDAEKIIAIPNGGKRNPREAARLKAQGVTAGVPDLFLPVMCGGFGGLWIELKAPKTATSPAGKPTAAQLAKLQQLSEDGYCTALCYGWVAARDTIVGYLSQPQ